MLLSLFARVCHVHLMSLKQHQAAANPQNKSAASGRKSACRAAIVYTHHHHLVLLLQSIEG